MDTRISVDQVTDCAYFQTKGCIFKWFLHLTWAEHAEITSICSRATFTVLSGKAFEVFSTLNLLLEILDISNSFVFGASNFYVPVGVVWVSGTNMFLQEMAHTDL